MRKNMYLCYIYINNFVVTEKTKLDCRQNTVYKREANHELNSLKFAFPIFGEGYGILKWLGKLLGSQK